MYTCPVCRFDKLQDPPTDYNICDCCGTEFGLDDEFRSHAALRQEWIAAGVRWFFGGPPTGWNPWRQLNRGDSGANLVTNVAYTRRESGYVAYAAVPSVGRMGGSSIRLTGVFKPATNIPQTAQSFILSYPSNTGYASAVMFAAARHATAMPEDGVTVVNQPIGQAA